MMYRCGWAAKSGQERVLAVEAVEMTRRGFEWPLDHACLSHFDGEHEPDRDAWQRRLAASPVRVQWDPERSLRMVALPYRSLQIGLGGVAVDHYVDEWIIGLTDVTSLARGIRERLDAGDERGAAALLPPETPYPLPPGTAAAIGASPT